MSGQAVQAAAEANLCEAGAGDALALFGEVVLPTISKGVIVRRPRVVAMAERFDLDGRAVRRMQRLRSRYGRGPLLVRVPGRTQAVLLDPEHVQAVLAGTPHPFSPASAEKRAALTHLEPRVSLISRGPVRAERRVFNERVLESGCPVHSMADAFMGVVAQETATMLRYVGGSLSWEDFTICWHRIVRRVILGDGARDDHQLTDMLLQLRAAGNWAFLHPGRPRLLDRFLERMDGHLQRAEPGSLAARIAALPASEATAPADQVAHYFFAFDPGAMATWRALALLAAHPAAMEHARGEIAAAGGPDGWRDLPFVRASILESLRLWPTTPAIFRESLVETRWGEATMPAHTNILIFAPFFHRDDENLDYAHRFAPEIWLSPEPGGGWPLVPFSGGPGICPARDFVPMLGSAAMAAILAAREIELAEPERLDRTRPMPGLLDNYTIRFRAWPRAGAEEAR